MTPEIDWTAGDCIGYVACVYGTDGDQPGDCHARWGQAEDGLWWIDDGDEDVRVDTRGPYDTEAEARQAAEALASEQDEALAGESSEDVLERTLSERAGTPTSEGRYCVYWHTVLDDSHVVDRYETEDAATAAAEIAQRELNASHPGGGLRCGYEVRFLRGGEWIELEDWS